MLRLTIFSAALDNLAFGTSAASVGFGTVRASRIVGNDIGIGSPDNAHQFGPFGPRGRHTSGPELFSLEHEKIIFFRPVATMANMGIENCIVNTTSPLTMRTNFDQPVLLALVWRLLAMATSMGLKFPVRCMARRYALTKCFCLMGAGNVERIEIKSHLCDCSMVLLLICVKLMALELWTQYCSSHRTFICYTKYSMYHPPYQRATRARFSMSMNTSSRSRDEFVDHDDCGIGLTVPCW